MHVFVIVTALVCLITIEAVDTVDGNGALYNEGEPAAVVADLTTMVLQGASGSLAKKYLWQAFFEVYQTQLAAGVKVDVIAAGRSASQGPAVHALLPTSVKCPANDSNCEDLKAQFISSVRYVSLKAEADYQALCNSLNLREAKLLSSTRAFYLSVPPFSYGEIVHNIHNHCRNFGAKKGSLRVAIEKPFGSDLASAEEMVRQLSVLKEWELYRVDHYLGKRGVQQITEFRNSNPAYEELLHRDCVKYVEIAMLETEDCEGRTGFYDSYGVVRDVMQNHLTEMLAVLAMDLLPAAQRTSAAFIRAKAELLRQVTPAVGEHTRLGQYADYVTHVRADHPDTPEKTSETPTFAVSILYVNSTRWEGVPFLIVSGKQLRERRAHVLVAFKRCVETCPDEYCAHPALVFQLHGPENKFPFTQRTDGPPKFVVPGTFVSADADADNHVERGRTERILPTKHADRPYDFLVERFFAGDRSNFVSNEGLLAAWRVWTPLLQQHSQPPLTLYNTDDAIQATSLASLGFAPPRFSRDEL